MIESEGCIVQTSNKFPVKVALKVMQLSQVQYDGWHAEIPKPLFCDPEFSLVPRCDTENLCLSNRTQQFLDSRC